MTVTKQDSNLTGLAFAEEQSIKTLPTTPVWYPLQPNTYKDFGGQTKQVARSPINNTRQRLKGATVDLDASGGLNQDFTMNNLTRLLQGFFFANLRQKTATQPMNGAALTCSGVAANKYSYGSNPGTFRVGALVLASAFSAAANNGVKNVSAADSTGVTVTQTLTAEASPPATAKLEVIGQQGASGDITMNVTAGVVTLLSTTLDFTTLGLIPGEWFFLGGDTTATQLGANVGLCRIANVAIAAHSITLDKTDFTAVTDAGTGKTVQLYFGNVLRNEPVYSNIVRRSYNIERQLGNDDDGTMAEYLVGAIPNELTFNVPQADKVNVDLSFVALDNEQHTGVDGLKSGTRVTDVSEDAINTSSDVGRIKLALVGTGTSSPSPLFAYSTDLNITISNNVTPNKAVGVLGAFNASTGTFEVSGKLTAYFADINATKAVRNNSDVTIDVFFGKSNKGTLLDLPLIALGDGRLSVEQDKPITLPLDTNAAMSPFGYTTLMMFFPYLPNAAM
jgi:hypothetical protein